MKVAYFDSPSSNPYQEQFFSSVANAGVDVTPLRLTPKFYQQWNDDFDILHLDWLHALYKTRRGLVATLAKSLYANWALSQIGRQAKIVHTFHNVVSHDSSLPRALETRLVQTLISRINAFTVFNDVSCDALHKNYRLRNDQICSTIPHGNYIDSYTMRSDKLACRAELGIPADVFLFMFFGALRENKGITDLVRVFPAVHQRCGAHLVVAGGNPTDRVTDSLRHQPPSIHVRDDGIPEQAVPTYFGACDAVVLPFRSILNSGSTILAASLGKHSVLPDLDSLTASLQSGTYTVYPVNDLRRLTDALVSVASMDRRQLDQSGADSRQYVKETLAWELIGKRTLNLYQTVLGDSPFC